MCVAFVKNFQRLLRVSDNAIIFSEGRVLFDFVSIHLLPQNRCIGNDLNTVVINHCLLRVLDEVILLRQATASFMEVKTVLVGIALSE